MNDPYQKRIKELEKQIANEKLKLIAYEKLIENIEAETGINLTEAVDTTRTESSKKPKTKEI